LLFFFANWGLEWFTLTKVVLASSQLPKLPNGFTAFGTHSSLHTQCVRRLLQIAEYRAGFHCHYSLCILDCTYQEFNWVIACHSVTDRHQGAILHFSLTNNARQLQTVASEAPVILSRSLVLKNQPTIRSKL